MARSGYRCTPTEFRTLIAFDTEVDELSAEPRTCTGTVETYEIVDGVALPTAGLR